MVALSTLPFPDRYEAGRILARELISYRSRADMMILALPRGGVPVAYEVAVALQAPLDVFLVRKLGVPGHPELALGAIASGGVRVVNEDILRELDLGERDVDRVAAVESREILRRERAYRGDQPALDVAGRTIILIDDGLATGATMRAAAQAIQAQRPKWLVVAVPVAARETCDEFRTLVDHVVCAVTPDPFYAVGLWYRDFAQTSDDEVRLLLARSRGRAENVREKEHAI
jgi:putative phosphoribosyl transferase